MVKSPSKIKFIFKTNHDNDANLFNFDAGDHAGTIIGHANSAGAIAVGAVEHQRAAKVDDYWNGQSSTERNVEDFSSTGGVVILRNSAGSVISPELRLKPDVLGADGVSTTTGLNPFYGTSAAAPHAAAIGALMKEAKPSVTPEQIRHALRFQCG